ncbi:hypothetical protein [Bradyrhizobium sp. AZCC 1693]|uniref:hypothetical protein n=1 Tax=Bradyrhizobium sp. AZCC 1693 TaxID=3117029 RepID=UPI002FF1D1FD
MACTEITRRQDRREGLRYASGLSDTERGIAEAIDAFPVPHEAAETDLRAVANAIILNLKTAKNHGLTILPGVLAIAEEVIE